MDNMEGLFSLISVVTEQFAVIYGVGHLSFQNILIRYIIHIGTSVPKPIFRRL